MSRVAVVTGSNKGIGFSIVKLLCQRFDGVVYLTSRDVERGKEAVKKLEELGLHPNFHQLDVSVRSSVEIFKHYLEENYGGIDILINNAAVVDAGFKTCSFDEAKRVIDINYRSILTMHELIYPIVRNGGRILNISSDCGHLSNIRNKFWIEKLSKQNLSVSDVNEFVEWFLESKKNGTFNVDDIANGASVAAYRVSKVAVSAVTMIHQKEYDNKNISINSMHPGLVRTDMTAGVGFYNVDEAAQTPVYIVLDAPQSLKGAYVWFDRKVIDWYDYNADYYFKMKTITG
ncbi:carbonyl reductase [NADPH] 3-like [Danaus plexippus]|uniref:carbonyl reductase [NADPH] 3-like n=1 Tax=Danaus plexippus TaxID=13037 RepID=UPI002AAFD9EB|nr:carbonyl reductase [NADPH] 3-like [Danaus plexippus]